MDQKAMFKITYGLYLASVTLGEKMNGCIINTVAQVAETPNRLAISISKRNYTDELVKKAGKLVVSPLSTKATMDTFKHFGFQSGRDVDKFSNIDYKTVDGIPYIDTCTLGYLVCQVLDTLDLGTHTLFIVEVADGAVLSDDEPITYNYYQANVKPKPTTSAKKGYRCTICNYIYEGDTLPSDYVCPLCKHGAADFVPV